jgi:TetR/AcrR family transcriptional regulator, tetracycline repressor protein
MVNPKSQGRAKARRAAGDRSRRTGRTALNRERVVKAALDMLDLDGVDRFSLRRLAEHLGVTPMAVYNHVSSKQALLRGVAEYVVAGAKYREVRGDWRAAVRDCFRTLRRTCLAHPGAVPLIESAEALPPSTFRPMEITLTVLEDAGLSSRDALRAYFLLTTFTLGQVSYQIRGWGRGVDPGAAIRDDRLESDAFPAVVHAVSSKPWDFDASFEFGLSVIIAGLGAQRRK